MSRPSMKGISEAVRRQVGTDKPQPQGDGFDPEALVRFSPDLPRKLEPAERERLASAADELSPWLQGPFLLGGDLVVGGLWRNDLRWEGLGKEVATDLSGQRVLDIGSNAGYDPFMFKLRGAEHVLGCEPWGFIEQARFLESIYESGVDLQQLGWQQLDPERHDRFDLVHCNGVLYHERNPLELLDSLFRLTEPGGTLLLGSMMLPDPEQAELARFIPGSYYEDPTWWWVPGRQALRKMIEAAGFQVMDDFGEAPGPPGEFPVVNGYVRAVRAR
jgi:SAM-dependent methyltransferase